jgi:hypothetical protein
MCVLNFITDFKCSSIRGKYSVYVDVLWRVYPRCGSTCSVHNNVIFYSSRTEWHSSRIFPGVSSVLPVYHYSTIAPTATATSGDSACKDEHYSMLASSNCKIHHSDPTLGLPQVKILRFISTLWHWVSWWCSWLRHCATSCKVAGSFSGGIIGTSHWLNPSGRTVALGPTSSDTYEHQICLQEVKAAGACGWHPCQSYVPIV